MDTASLLERIQGAQADAEYTVGSSFRALADQVKADDAARVLHIRGMESPDRSLLTRKLSAHNSLFLTVPAKSKHEAAPWIRWIRECGWERSSIYESYAEVDGAEIQWVFKHPRWEDIRLYFALDFTGNKESDNCRLIGRTIMEEITEFELVCFDEGIADGGESYTDEELNLINGVSI